MIRTVAIGMLMLAYLVIGALDMKAGNYQTGVASWLLMAVNCLLFMGAR